MILHGLLSPWGFGELGVSISDLLGARVIGRIDAGMMSDSRGGVPFLLSLYRSSQSVPRYSDRQRSCWYLSSLFSLTFENPFGLYSNNFRGLLVVELYSFRLPYSSFDNLSVSFSRYQTFVISFSHGSTLGALPCSVKSGLVSDRRGTRPRFIVAPLFRAEACRVILLVTGITAFV